MGAVWGGVVVGVGRVVEAGGVTAGGPGEAGHVSTSQCGCGVCGIAARSCRWPSESWHCALNHSNGVVEHVCVFVRWGRNLCENRDWNGWMCECGVCNVSHCWEVLDCGSAVWLSGGVWENAYKLLDPARTVRKQ